MRLDQRLDFGTYCFLKKHKISLFIFICLKPPVSLASYPNRSVQVERGKRKRIGERGNLQLLFTAKDYWLEAPLRVIISKSGFLQRCELGFLQWQFLELELGDCCYCQSGPSHRQYEANESTKKCAF